MSQQPASDWHGFDPEVGAPHDRDVLDDRTDALGKLSSRGQAECFPHPDAGGRKYLWQSTD